MKKIYLVRGFTGEYSDARDWTVCAYDNKEDAEEHAKRAGEACKNFKYDCLKKPKNKYDPYFGMDYTGTEYHIEEVLLWEASDFEEFKGDRFAKIALKLPGND